MYFTFLSRKIVNFNNKVKKIDFTNNNERIKEKKNTNDLYKI